MKKNEKETTKRFTKETKKEKSNFTWAVQITLVAIIISFLFSFASEMILPGANVFLGVLLVVLFIVLGIIFDIIGVAVTIANEKPFHSMSAQKIRGAKLAIILKNNANKVSSFCNDVIGDICGIISGSAGSIIAISIAKTFSLNAFIITLLVTSTIAGLTIGGKALGKSIAIHKSNVILYEFSKYLSYFYNPKK